MLLDTVEVESNEPTVSWDVVAIKLPLELVVMMELAGNVLARKTCVARVEVEIVDTSPEEPVYAKPCVSDGRYTEDPNVDEAVEKRPPVNPSTDDVDAPYDVNGRM